MGKPSETPPVPVAKAKRSYTTLSISHETKRELETIGTIGQKYDDLIKELILLKKNGGK
jgi:hypothetical protein